MSYLTTEERNTRMVIYRITNMLSGMKYIGQTRRKLKDRINKHLKERVMLVDQAIQDQGVENFKIELVCICSSLEELNQKEIELIASEKTIWPGGYNIASGGKVRGDHPFTKMLCRLWYQQHRQEHTDIMNSPEVLKKISERTLEGIYKNPEEIDRRKMSMWLKNNDPKFKRAVYFAQCRELVKNEDGNYYLDYKLYDLIHGMVVHGISFNQMAKELSVFYGRKIHPSGIPALVKRLQGNYPQCILDDMVC